MRGSVRRLGAPQRRQFTPAFARPSRDEQQRARPFEAGTRRLPQTEGPFELFVITVQATGGPGEAGGNEVVLFPQWKGGRKALLGVGPASNDRCFDVHGSRLG